MTGGYPSLGLVSGCEIPQISRECVNRAFETASRPELLSQDNLPVLEFRNRD